MFAKQPRVQALLHSKSLGFTVIFGYAAIGVSIALFAPADILTQHAWARAFVDVVGSAIPSIEKIGRFSTLSELAQFHLAVMWALGPVMMAYIFLGVIVQRPHELKDFFVYIRARRLRMFFLWLLVAPAFVLALYFLSPGEQPGMQLRAYLSSRVGLTFWTLVGPVGVFVLFSLWLGSLKFWKPLLSALFSRDFVPPRNESDR